MLPDIVLVVLMSAIISDTAVEIFYTTLSYYIFSCSTQNSEDFEFVISNYGLERGGGEREKRSF